MTARRISVIWPLLIILVAVGWLAQAFGVLPGATLDLVGRAWPALLVALGLMLLLGRRVRFGNLLAIVVSVAVVGGMVSVAYSQQAGKLRTDYHKALNQPIDPQTTSIKIDVDALIADIEVTTGDGSALTGEFFGSRESQIISDYQTDGPVGTFTLHESQNSTVASLDATGKGKLTLQLPANVTIDELTFTGGQGDVQFDVTAASLKNITLTTGTGNITVKLPEKSALIGTIKTGGGDVTIQVPPAVAANIALHGSAANNVQYNQVDYILDIQKVLNSRRASAPQIAITVEATGRIVVQ